ncbi:MAG TPA: hypothetical protein VLC48_07760 [Gemmatimonadota bacterium]|nr:hypothetical protein [Gemmatimonadota bacterium]
MSDMATEDKDLDVQKPDRGAKRRATELVILIALLGTLAFLSVDRYLDGMSVELREGDPGQVAHQLGSTLRLVAAGLGLLVFLMAGWLFRLARLVSKSGRFPPPGTRVIYETPVLTGAAARHKAYIGYALAAVLLFAGLVGTFLLWRVTESLLAL